MRILVPFPHSYAELAYAIFAHSSVQFGAKAVLVRCSKESQFAPNF